MFNHKGLDSVLSVEKGVVTAIIGGAGTGKTSLALCLGRNFNNPYLIDTEGVSLERIRQIGVENLKVARVREFENQIKLVESLKSKPDFLIIDSLVMLYRLEVAKDHKVANKMLSNHIYKLHSLADSLNIPVVVTGHIYKKNRKNHVVGGDIVKYWAKTIVLLEKHGFGKRRATLLKSRSKREGLSADFKLCERGVC